MTAPRHLWSGDWRLESAAVAEELAARRAETQEHAEAPPASPRPIRPSQQPTPRSPRPMPPAAVRAFAWLRNARRPTTVRGGPGRRVRAMAPLGLAALLSAGVAFAAVSVLIGSGNRRSPTVSSAPGWLGVDTMSFPLGGGVMIADVAPGSPAEAAGLQPGDVITQIDNGPVATPDDVTSAVDGMHAGERLVISYARGPMTYRTQVTLAARPPNHP